MAPLRCPVCGKLFEPDQSGAMPFCSQRCREIDLGRWLDEKYGLPYESEDEPEKPEKGDCGRVQDSGMTNDE